MEALNLPNNTISTLAQFFGNIISFIYDEVLVKDLEHLSTMEVIHIVVSVSLGILM